MPVPKLIVPKSSPNNPASLRPVFLIKISIQVQVLATREPSVQLQMAAKAMLSVQGL